MKLKPFKAYLMFMLFIILTLLFSHSLLLGMNKAAGTISVVQEKGGVVKPNPTPRTTSRPQSSGQSSRSTNSARRSASMKSKLRRAPEIEMVFIQGGTFTMGSPESEEERNGGEGPQHSVTVQSFYLGKYEITQAQWQAIMGTTVLQQREKAGLNWRMAGEGENHPMYFVSWNEAQEFIRKLNAMQSRYVYRLPTEAEWEYACRAGTTGMYAGNLDAMAWYSANSGDMTHPVGTKQPNRWGLYDMHGNVWEWCEDVRHSNYKGAPSDGSAWMSGGEPSERMRRGGSWSDETYSMFVENRLRSAARSSHRIDWRISDIGFRVAASVRP